MKSLLTYSHPNCDFAILVENTKKPNRYDCEMCKRPFCQRCSQVWHPNVTCEVASNERAARDPTLQMLTKSQANGGLIRSCPRCEFTGFLIKKKIMDKIKSNLYLKKMIYMFNVDMKLAKFLNKAFVEYDRS